MEASFIDYLVTIQAVPVILAPVPDRHGEETGKAHEMSSGIDEHFPSRLVHVNFYRNGDRLPGHFLTFCHFFLFWFSFSQWSDF
jgi:hypothetical protein